MALLFRYLEEKEELRENTSSATGAGATSADAVLLVLVLVMQHVQNSSSSNDYHGISGSPLTFRN